jgi:iron uptake system EfeUOB component EfeO/EfeM
LSDDRGVRGGRVALVAVALAALFAAGLLVGGALTGDDDPAPAAHPRPGRIVAAPSALAPLSPAAFHGPVAAYRRYVERRLAGLAANVAQLRVAITAGHRAAARTAWRRAYANYGRVGAAYGAFGNLDAAIGGTADGLPRGARDSRFRGLHRIEQVLWGATALSAATTWTARLTRDVARLRVRARTLTIDPLEYSIRAHEILEIAKRDQLGGRVVAASGEGVLGLAAAVGATGEVLHTLSGLLAGRSGAQQSVGTALVRLRTQLRAVRTRHDGYPPLDALSRREHELLTARTDAALEALAQVPGALETTPVAPPPAIGSERG